MKLAVFAYQEIGFVCLEALLEAGGEVALVLTHEDDPGEEIWFRSVAGLARRHGIPVFTPPNPNEPETVQRLSAIRPDFIFSFYYRHLLAAEVLNTARGGAYNLHGSLLPKYRGRAPVNWVLVNGETETGVTLHRMWVKPDAGPIAARKRVPIAETDTAADLYAKMVEAAAGLIRETWPELAAGRIEETPQDESRATCYGRRRPRDGRIDWRWSAKRVYDLQRAVTHPYPRAFSYRKGRKLYIWSAEYALEPPWPEIPGRILPPERNHAMTVACGRGRLFVRAAQWEGEPERKGADLPGLGLTPGMNFDMERTGL